MAAAYECTISLTDDETFLFNIQPRDTDGNPPIWADYTFEYALDGCGVALLLTEVDGIEIDEALDIIAIGPADRAYRLPVGTYSHGFRMTEISSGTTFQQFDGTVTVSQGNFS